jgi:hypothetical protein
MEVQLRLWQNDAQVPDTASLINPLIFKRLFSIALNEKGYSYVIYSSINRQNLQLESHGSQL